PSRSPTAGDRCRASAACRSTRSRERTGCASAGGPGFTHDQHTRTLTSGHAPEDDMRKWNAAMKWIGASLVACAGLAGAVHAQTIKLGELNSYKAQPAFLEPYRKGW